MPDLESSRKPWLNFQKGLKKFCFQDAANFSATLTTRLKEIDAVADEMVAKVESMKKEMITRKEVNIISWMKIFAIIF